MKMKFNPKFVIDASKKILSRKNYLIAFVGLIVLLFGIFVLIPVFFVPGNSLLFQLSIFTSRDYVLLTVLSLLTSLLIVMQVYSYKQSKINSLGKTTVGAGSSFIAALFGTASCSSCVAAVFGFLGVGTVFFLLKYKWPIIGASISLMLISLYLVSLKIDEVCI